MNRATTTTTSTTDLTIEGMTCGSCVRHVDAALRSVAGVLSVDVSLREARASVRHAASESAVPALIAALDAAGYPAFVATDE